MKIRIGIWQNRLGQLMLIHGSYKRRDSTWEFDHEYYPTDNEYSFVCYL